MKYETKLALQIFIIGAIILSVGLYTSYRYNYSNVMQQELGHTASIINEVSVNFEQQLTEKIKTNQTLSIAPILKNAVKTSNNILHNFSEKDRNEMIHNQNEKWKAIKDENNAFILEYTDNKAAQFLKAQQNNLKGEYGEIFLTNKYGALVASTSKLTTLAHAHKYWWKGAYNKGLGKVFIDDRGYDESVNGYVLGLVIPIKEGEEVIGILKVNLNILDVIGKIILNSQSKESGKFKLIRSGGEIIFEEGVPSLTTRIPNFIYKKLQFVDEQSFLFYDSNKKWMIGKSEISITSKSMKNYIFGGSFESKDHKKGNSGESWFIINYRDLTKITKSLNQSTLIILSIGFLLIMILAFLAFILGKNAVKPLKDIINQSIKISESDFSGRIIVTRKDEIGVLGEAFNYMVEKLEKTTTSIINLELSQERIKKSELKLKKLANAIERLSESIVITDIKANIEYVNPAFVKVTGYDYEELIGKNPNILSSGIQDNKFYKNLWDTILAGNTWYGIFTNKNKNNEFFHEATSISPIFDDKSNIINFVAVKRDVTKEMLLQNQLNEAQKLESIGVLASGIAHEINTPLQYIMDNLEYVIDSFNDLGKYGQVIYKYLDMNSEVVKARKDLNVEFIGLEIPEALKDSLTGVKVIQEIIKSMRVFSHNSKDKQITTEINTYIKSAIEISKNSWKGNTEIKLNLTKNTPKIEINIGQINQVLLNLIVNASDAIKSNVNKNKNNEIIVSSYIKGEYFIISIKDTGAGISYEDKNKVFDIFFTTKDVGKGSGQGLSISHDIIVNKHRGKLYFESEHLSGTTFYIELPLFKQDIV